MSSSDIHEYFTKRFHPADGCPDCGRYTYFRPLKSIHNLFFFACEDHRVCWLCIPRWLHGYDPERPPAYWRDDDYFRNKEAIDAKHASKTLSLDQWALNEEARRKAVAALWKPDLPQKKKKLLKQLGLTP